MFIDKKRILWILIAFLIGFFLKFIIENIVCQNVCPLVEGAMGDIIKVGDMWKLEGVGDALLKANDLTVDGWNTKPEAKNAYDKIMKRGKENRAALLKKKDEAMQSEGMAEWHGEMYSTDSRQSEAAETAQREAKINIAQEFMETGKSTKDFSARLTLGEQQALQTTAAAEAEVMAANDEHQNARYTTHSGEGVNLPILRREEYNAEGGPNPHVMFWWKEGWKGNHTNWNELMEKVRTKLYETKDGEPKGMRRANGILKIKISTNSFRLRNADVLNFNGDAVVGVPDDPDPRTRVLRNLSQAMGLPPEQQPRLYYHKPGSLPEEQIHAKLLGETPVEGSVWRVPKIGRGRAIDSDDFTPTDPDDWLGM